jgi:DNA-binding NtrC family response regulator
MKHPILLVDDEPFIHSSIRRLLRKLPIELTNANNGDEAIMLMKEQHFEVIISDMRMPGLSGVAVLQHARSLQADATCILLSGYSESELMSQATTQQLFDHYVEKPWDDQALVELVSKALKPAI